MEKSFYKKTNLKLLLSVVFYLSIFFCLFLLLFPAQTKTNVVKAQEILCEQNEESSENNTLFDVEKTEKNNVSAGEIPLTISSISASNKIYDGTNIVNLNIAFSGQSDGDIVYIEGFGTVASPNVGEGKIVSIDENDVVLAGEDSINYYIENYSFPENLSISITPYPATVNWNITGESSTFDYSSTSPRSKIKPYYLDISESRVYLNYSVSGTNYSRTENYPSGEFVSPGIYDANILVSMYDANYTLSDSTADLENTFYISRITPSFEFLKTSFTYNGLEQDLSNFVKVDNSEQTIVFDAPSSKFTTYSEGYNLINVSLNVSQTDNYKEASTSFSFQMNKATPTVDDSALAKVYTYTGQVLNLDSTLVTIDNNEQSIMIIKQSSEVFKNAGEYTFTIQAVETENYSAYIDDNVTFTIVKKQVDVSGLNWQSVTSFIYQKGVVRNVYLSSYSDEVTVSYGGTYFATNAGTYTATASISANDSNNVEVIGSVNSLVWKISKRVQTLPTLTSQSTFTYDGNEKQIVFSVMASPYF